MVKPSEDLAKYLVRVIASEFDQLNPRYHKIYIISRLLARVIAPDNEQLSELIKQIEEKRYGRDELIIDFAGLVLHMFEKSFNKSISTFNKEGEKKESMK